jgi:hypothetical protein
VAAISAAVALALCAPSPVLADGDPASDVLASQALFLSQDAGAPPARREQLAALLGGARRDGCPIRVALIASKADLGSVTGLWRQPDSYAKFLGQELSLVNRAPLLVVMPDGFGFYDPTEALSTARSALRGIAISTSNGGIASAALTAVQRVCAAAGHPLQVPQAAAPPTSGSSSVLPWIVFAGGTALILAAWSASLRARPLRRRA